MDIGRMLSPALLEHKDFRASGHKTSQKVEKTDQKSKFDKIEHVHSMYSRVGLSPD